MKRPLPRLAILGAGPIGLEAALLARKLGLTVSVFERGRVGENLERWGFVRMFSPFGMNSTPLGRATLKSENPHDKLPGDVDILTGREHVAAYLAPLAESSLLDGVIKTETQVLAISRATLFKSDLPGQADKRGEVPFRLLLRDGKGAESTFATDAVLDCGGCYGFGRFLGGGGLPVPGELAARNQIAFGLEDVLGGQRGKYAGKTTLVLGAGYTAATHVCLLSELAAQNTDTWVIWLTRGPRSQPLPRNPEDPLRERDRLAARANNLATRGEGNIEFHPSSVIERITTLGPDKGFQVAARVSGKEQQWDVERIVASVGYRPDKSIWSELQVQECPALEGPAGVGAILIKQAVGDGPSAMSCGVNALRTTEPNFFVLGAKSYGRNPNFLLKAGFEQVREVMGILVGKTAHELPVS